MQTKQPDTMEQRAEDARREDARIEGLLFQMLTTPVGKGLVAWVVHGSHNLEHTYTPGMSFDVAAWNAGRQFSAREIIRVARTTERCSLLLDAALRAEAARILKREGEDDA